ncbi:MAG: hypothetical protein H6509_12890 [Bryobacterales bacterium]|nr:hypothetical protein [Bryobacterales bacterium]
MRVALVCILLASLALRAVNLTKTAFWVDEAETAINALTILEHGYPTDQYLGIPIFENMLIRLWPDNPEYEYRDVSYSDRGMAVYHAWLPLYSIAASFWAFGIEPQEPDPGWQIHSDKAEMARRTLAARLPSLIFTLLFLLAFFVAARRMAGDAAALSAVALAGLSATVVELTLYARYYALMLALSAAAAATLWRVIERGSRRDFALHSVVLVLLFYTHLIALANLVILTSLMLLMFQRNKAAFSRWGLSLGLVAVCGLPWIIETGYLQHLGYIPSGMAMVRLPGDLIDYVLSRQVGYQILTWIGVSWLVLAWVRHGAALPLRLREPWQRHGRQYTLVLIWSAIAVATYLGISPAASLFPQRLTLALIVPAFLFMAMTLNDALRTIIGSRDVLAAPAAAIAFLAISGILRPPIADSDAFSNLEETFEAINHLELRPDAKVYASPASHLILTFYSGKPIQSIAPVRKSFLDNYPGEVLFTEVQFVWEFAAPSRDDIREVANRLGTSLTDEEIEEMQAQLRTRFARERTAPLVSAVEPPLEPLSRVAQEVMREVREHAEESADQEEIRWSEPQFGRGFSIRSNANLWQTFYYRLIDPASRSGILNAAARLHAGVAYFVPQAFRVIFYSPHPLVSSPAAQLAQPSPASHGGVPRLQTAAR